MENTKEYINIKELSDVLFTIFHINEENRIVDVSTDYIFGGPNFLEKNPNALYNSYKHHFIIEIGDKESIFKYKFRAKFEKDLMPYIVQKDYEGFHRGIYQYIYNLDFLSELEIEVDSIENYYGTVNFNPEIIFASAIENLKYEKIIKSRKKDE